MNGSRTWAIPEGYIPEGSTGPESEMTSHETLCVLNTGDEEAPLEEIPEEAKGEFTAAVGRAEFETNLRAHGTNTEERPTLLGTDCYTQYVVYEGEYY